MLIFFLLERTCILDSIQVNRNGTDMLAGRKPTIAGSKSRQITHLLYTSRPILLGAGSSDSKESPHAYRRPGFHPWSGRSLEEGMSNHSSTLAWRIPMYRGAWWAAVQGVVSPGGRKVLDMIEQLHTANFSS